MDPASILLHRRVSPPSVTASWRRQSWPLRILRAFLGVTFVYAGVQKLADANFLHAGTPDYIGSQLQAFGRGSPLHPVFAALAHVPVLTGVFIALLELAIGLGTLLGIAPMTWAILGLAVNLALFLSATWHVHPYFLGSDSMYAVGWAAYLAGLVEVELRAARARMAQGTRRARRAASQQEVGRREFLRAGLVGLGTLALGSFAAVLAGKPTRAGAARAFQSPTQSPPGRQPASSPASAPRGTPVASLDSVPVGGAVSFNDPAQGPALLVRLSQQQVAAYSRVCTHAGCLVEWDQTQRIMVCPCHGAEFDPSRGGAPIAGPAFSPLQRIDVTVDHATKQVLASD